MFAFCESAGNRSTVFFSDVERISDYVDLEDVKKDILDGVAVSYTSDDGVLVPLHNMFIDFEKKDWLKIEITHTFRFKMFGMKHEATTFSDVPVYRNAEEIELSEATVADIMKLVVDSIHIGKMKNYFKALGMHKNKKDAKYLTVYHAVFITYREVDILCTPYEKWRVEENLGLIFEDVDFVHN